MCFKMKDFVVLRTQRFQMGPNQLVCCMSKQWYLFFQAKIILFKVLCDKVHNYDPKSTCLAKDFIFFSKCIIR